MRRSAGVQMLLAAWGGMDLWQVSRQRQLLLAPGQPASLGPEVSREGALSLETGFDPAKL